MEILTLGKRDDIRARFGERLRRLRVERNFTQEQFGFECGLDRTYISGIERGVRNVSLENIEKISQGLNITIAELFRDL